MGRIAIYKLASSNRRASIRGRCFHPRLDPRSCNILPSNGILNVSIATYHWFFNA